MMKSHQEMLWIQDKGEDQIRDLMFMRDFCSTLTLESLLEISILI